jgi:hypothetical protein
MMVILLCKLDLTRQLYRIKIEYNCTLVLWYLCIAGFINGTNFYNLAQSEF